MTPIELKTPDGEVIKSLCPSSWQEMTTSQYIRIIKEWEDGSDVADRDYAKLFNILCDGKFSRIENTIENQVTLINLVGWVITEPFEFSTELPKVIQISGKIIDIPRDPRDLSIGQNIHLRRDFIDQSKKLEENIAIATAIYLQPIIDNSLFNINRAKEICKEVEGMPISIVYPVGFFFLERALTFGTRHTQPYSRVKISLRQIFARMLPGWLRFKG